MTKTHITSHITFACMLVLLAGTSFAFASEVTGTLSSDTVSKAAPTGSISGSVTNEPTGSISGTVTTTPTGNLTGTVTSNDSGGSSGGSTSSGSGGSSSSDTPSGLVLGVTPNDSQTPAFPNAGVNPQHNTSLTLWSDMVQLLRNLLTF